MYTILRVVAFGFNKGLKCRAKTLKIGLFYAIIEVVRIMTILKEVSYGKHDGD